MWQICGTKYSLFNTTMYIAIAKLLKIIATLKVTHYLIFFSILFRGVVYSVMCFILFFLSCRELCQVL